MANPDLRNLPRLEQKLYQAFAAIHWTMKVEPSTPGWLDENFHRSFRDVVLHACLRERTFCPAYCLMPDHLHLMWLGTSLNTDQLNGIKFLRTHLNRLLAGEPLENRESVEKSSAVTPVSARWKLQPQAHDHVLREKERKRNAFAKTCFYVLANPVRANLATREQNWPFSGAIVPGYPDLYPFQKGYWEIFWKLYNKHREPEPSEQPKPK
jgi:putative transposase